MRDVDCKIDVFTVYFVRSGLVYFLPNTGAFRHAGQVVYLWSSRGGNTNLSSGISSPGSYLLDISYTNGVVKPSQGPYARSYGFPLRCLSTVLDI